MTATTPSPDSPSPVPSSAGGETPPGAASIANLTATLRADYEALQNDLEQAQELAADFQRQLAGKSNEVAHFKTLLEKAQHDLARMEGHIAELRRERHRLANEVMEVTGLRAELQIMQTERDQFRREAEALRSALTASGGDYQERIKQQEAELIRLRAAFEALRNRQVAAATKPPGEAAAGVHHRIAELSATVDRLESIIKTRAGQAAPTGPATPPSSQKAAGEDDFIDISFHS